VLVVVVILTTGKVIRAQTGLTTHSQASGIPTTLCRDMGTLTTASQDMGTRAIAHQEAGEDGLTIHCLSRLQQEW